MDQCQANLTHLSENFPTDIFSSSILEATQFLSSGKFPIDSPENTGMSPLFNSNNLLMGDDHQSILPLYFCPDRQRQASFDFFSGRGGHGLGRGRAFIHAR